LPFYNGIQVIENLMLKKHNPTLLSTLIYSLSLFILISCQATSKDHKTNTTTTTYTPIKATISASFSDDGQLWRLIPTKEAIFVDFSLDNGATYSSPVQVNSLKQKISAWPENPPAINISSSGRINVLYYADTDQKSTSFFSYSDDNGKTFSTPALISDHAKSAMHYMDKMLIDKDNNAYLFWHDTRHESHSPDWGEGALSLYYSIKKPLDNSQFVNKFISNGICSCCRTATAFSNTGMPVIFARMVYKDGIRDHALIRMNNDNTWSTPQRATYDQWAIEACPEHGPSIAIDQDNRTHMTWFTLGDIRTGIFYAYTDDFGKTTSAPIPLGNINHLPSHADVISLNQRVIIAWKEFDGEHTTLHIKESLDRGESWLDKKTTLATSSQNNHPKLLNNSSDLFLSWTTQDEGHRILKL